MNPGGYNIFTAVVLTRNPGGEFGGYRTDHFINPVELLCSFCRQVPREPQSVPCGHIFCHECLITNIVIPRQPCSQCRSPVRREDCVPDVHLARRVADSSISCPYSEKCQWAGYLSSLTSHFSECTHINPMLRSWMQSIQAHISDVATESGRLERRVDRLAELVNKMNSRCEASGYEYEKQLNWIGNHMDYVQQDVLKTCPRRYNPPQGYIPPQEYIPPQGYIPPQEYIPLQGYIPPQEYQHPPFHPPAGGVTQDYASLMIDETDMTESLRLDIAMTKQQMPPRAEPAEPNTTPRRNVRFSVYEDHVRQDAGDATLELYEPDDVIAYRNDMFAFPQFVADPAFNKCLHCDRFNVSASKRCKFCERII